MRLDRVLSISLRCVSSEPWTSPNVLDTEEARMPLEARRVDAHDHVVTVKCNTSWTFLSCRFAVCIFNVASYLPAYVELEFWSRHISSVTIYGKLVRPCPVQPGSFLLYIIHTSSIWPWPQISMPPNGRFDADEPNAHIKQVDLVAWEEMVLLLNTYTAHELSVIQWTK